MTRRAVPGTRRTSPPRRPYRTSATRLARHRVRTRWVAPARRPRRRVTRRAAARRPSLAETRGPHGQRRTFQILLRAKQPPCPACWGHQTFKELPALRDGQHPRHCPDHGQRGSSPGRRPTRRGQDAPPAVRPPAVPERTLQTPSDPGHVGSQRQQLHSRRRTAVSGLHAVSLRPSRRRPDTSDKDQDSALTTGLP
jgi:hypothetical protein